MSIYPVRLAEWFPKKADAGRNPEEAKNLYENVKMALKYSKCCECGKTPNYKWAYGMHSIPWGYGTEGIWCSKKCFTKV